MHSLLYFEVVTLKISHPVVLGLLVLTLGHTCIPDVQTHLCFCQLPLPRNIFREKNKKSKKNPQKTHALTFTLLLGEGGRGEKEVAIKRDHSTSKIPLSECLKL